LQILCLFLFCTFLACVDASNSVSPNITLPPVDDFPAATPEHVGLDSQKLNALSQMIAAGDYGDIQSLQKYCGNKIQSFVNIDAALGAALNFKFNF
jgi:hypothetical protein